MSRIMNNALLSLVIPCLMWAVSAQAAHHEELPFGMESNHLNLVLSVSDPAKVHEFYGDILGLERLKSKSMPEKSKLYQKTTDLLVSTVTASWAARVVIGSGQ